MAEAGTDRFEGGFSEVDAEGAAFVASAPASFPNPSLAFCGNSTTIKG